MGMPKFCEGLSLAAQKLLETHLELPREVHYVADIQRWLLSQVTLAIHFDHKLDVKRGPITPNSLLRFFGETPIASKNTVLSFLMEMRQYKYVEAIEAADRRYRTFKATEMSERLIRRYFDIHLCALDVVDGGSRYPHSCADPSLLYRAQPRFARLLLMRSDWYRPPQAIASFVKSDSGSSIVHEIVSNAPHDPLSGSEPIWIGPVSPSDLAKRYMISRTHAARLFATARQNGMIGWASPRNRGDCWIAPEFVRTYRFWQAIKLSAVSQAVEHALASDCPSRC